MIKVAPQMCNNRFLKLDADNQLSNTSPFVYRIPFLENSLNLTSGSFMIAVTVTNRRLHDARKSDRSSLTGLRFCARSLRYTGPL